jgi:hypothetical protein
MGGSSATIAPNLPMALLAHRRVMAVGWTERVKAARLLATKATHLHRTRLGCSFRGVGRDLEQECFKQLADVGHSFRQNNHVLCLSHGRGVPGGSLLAQTGW